jgi:hypothetical protein
MSEPRVRYEDSGYYDMLRNEIAMLERLIHHEIDNYEMDMQKDLIQELKGLEKACRSVNKYMAKAGGSCAKGGSDRV